MKTGSIPFPRSSIFLMGLNWDRLTLEGYWRIGNAEAVGLGLPGQRSKNVNANDEQFALAA